MTLESIMRLLSMVVPLCVVVACTGLNQTSAVSVPVVEPRVSLSPTPALVPLVEDRFDCIMDPKRLLTDESPTVGSQSGRIVFQIERDQVDRLVRGTDETPHTEVWAVSEDGSDLTNLTYLNGTLPTGLSTLDVMVVSPDGLRLAFVAHHRDFIQGNFVSIMDTYGYDLSHFKLSTTEVAKSVRELAWSADGTRLSFNMAEYGRGGVVSSGFYTISENGLGNWQLLKRQLDGASSVHTFPSPDGQRTAYSVNPRDDEDYLEVRNINDASLLWTLKGLSPSKVIWSPNGQMLAFHTGPKGVYVFDSDGSCLLSITELLTSNYGLDGPPKDSGFDLRSIHWASDSQALLVTDLRKRLYVVNLRLASVDLFEIDKFINRLVFLQLQDPWDAHNEKLLLTLWVADDRPTIIATLDATSGQFVDITPRRVGKEHNTNAVWSPDKSKIAFVRHRNQKSQVIIMDSDGAGLIEITPELDLEISDLIWLKRMPQN